MFSAYEAVELPALRGIVVRRYNPTFWGRCGGKKPYYTLRVVDNTDGPFKAVDAGNLVILPTGQEFEIAGSFVLYSDDSRPEGAKYTVTFSLSVADYTLSASLFDNQTRQQLITTYWANGDMREVRRLNPDDE